MGYWNNNIESFSVKLDDESWEQLQKLSRQLFVFVPTLFEGVVVLPEIKRVIYHKPATVIVWKDGSKSVVKCDEVDEYNKEIGYLLCILKKILPSKIFYDLLERFYDGKGAKDYE